jgi:hypothetical protein
MAATGVLRDPQVRNSLTSFVSLKEREREREREKEFIRNKDTP